jgi:hypothetical protein
MAKIHTHYDNLKVARGAPQEVVRAAYKALSQKYHPDKNQGDEKAARIMAIVNTAYNILSDPVRRKEHDEWIAAEEWEVEWLESSGEETPRTRGENWESPPSQHQRRRGLLREPRWWIGMLGGVALGAVCALLLVKQPRLLPTALAFNAKPETIAPVTSVPARQPECDTDLATPTAPNGEPWPDQSGYISGYPMGNSGREMTVVVDNSANPNPLFVKIYDLERRSNVRHAYVLGNGMLTIDGLAAGKYEVRYQNIVGSAARAECNSRAARRAAASGF